MIDMTKETNELTTDRITLQISKNIIKNLKRLQRSNQDWYYDASFQSYRLDFKHDKESIGGLDIIYKKQKMFLRFNNSKKPFVQEGKGLDKIISLAKKLSNLFEKCFEIEDKFFFEIPACFVKLYKTIGIYSKEDLKCGIVSKDFLLEKMFSRNHKKYRFSNCIEKEEIRQIPICKNLNYLFFRKQFSSFHENSDYKIDLLNKKFRNILPGSSLEFRAYLPANRNSSLVLSEYAVNSPKFIVDALLDMKYLNQEEHIDLIEFVYSISDTKGHIEPGYYSASCERGEVHFDMKDGILQSKMNIEFDDEKKRKILISNQIV